MKEVVVGRCKEWRSQGVGRSNPLDRTKEALKGAKRTSGATKVEKAGEELCEARRSGLDAAIGSHELAQPKYGCLWGEFGLRTEDEASRCEEGTCEKGKETKEVWVGMCQKNVVDVYPCGGKEEEERSESV